MTLIFFLNSVAASLESSADMKDKLCFYEKMIDEGETFYAFFQDYAMSDDARALMNRI